MIEYRTEHNPIHVKDLPCRIQRRRVSGWKMPPNTISCCRPGRLGNPFVCESDPQVAVDAFRKLVTQNVGHFEISPGRLQFAKKTHPATLSPDYGSWLREQAIPKIRTFNLACFCPLERPCHVDVLLELGKKSLIQDGLLIP